MSPLLLLVGVSLVLLRVFLLSLLVALLCDNGIGDVVDGGVFVVR